MQKSLKIVALTLIGVSTLVLYGCWEIPMEINNSWVDTITKYIYTGGIYTDYSTNLIWSNEDVLLFFHADWCSTCEQARKSFAETWIPAGLTILEVNYDTEDELRRRYNILTQTSYVYINDQWESIKRRVGGRHIDDILGKINEAKSWEKKPREMVQKQEKNLYEAPTLWETQDTIIDTIPRNERSTAEAYFAWGCFWCMEWPFEATQWVIEAISWYIWWSTQTANYDDVSRWKTRHRESVKVIYDPNQVSYKELLEVYRLQIDPTDAWGQFADRWYHYTTAIYTNSDPQKEQAILQKQSLQDSGKFEEDIAVIIEDFTTFYPAEEYHQDYYKTNSAHYERYAKGSGRKWYIYETRSDRTGELFSDSKRNETEDVFEELMNDTLEKTKIKESKNEVRQEEQTINQKWWSTLPVRKVWELSDLQRKILFDGWTEPPFDNAYRDNKEPGIYVDAIDGTPLFSSTDKFDSGTWWPSFTQPISIWEIDKALDNRYGMKRTEVKSANSNGHLWHIFDDGPTEYWGQRYCINSAALVFIPLTDMDKMWYEEFWGLFQEQE